MIRVAALLRHRTVVAALVCLLAWAGWTAWQTAQVPGRISPSLRTALRHETLIPRVLVEVDFTPSDFHLTALQRYGSVGGVRGHEITLFQVEPADVWQMAHIFWIRRLDVPGGGG